MKHFKLMLIGALTSASMVLAGPYDAWKYYRTVTVNASGVSGTVTNYPVLVRLTNTSAATGKDVLDSALTGGADLRFATGNGATALSYEIERWTPSAAEIWVKVPSIAAGNGTIRMYWGKAAELSASNAAAVFDTANGFRAVYHMNEAEAANLTDATGLGHTAVVGSVSPTNVSTGLGVGKNFAKVANSGYSAAGTSHLNLDTAGSYTLSAWVQTPDCVFNGTNNRRFVVGRMQHQGQGQYALMSQANSPGFWQARLNTGVFFNATDKVQLSGLVACQANTWQYVSATYAGTGAGDTSRVRAFDNGTLSAKTDEQGSGVYNTDHPLTIGKSATDGTQSNFRMSGNIDEIRVSAVARSADWLKLDYDTQRPDSAKVALGVSAPNVPGPFDAWSNVRSIRLNTGATGAAVTGNVTNFPVLIRLTPAEASIISAAGTNGASIRFAKSNDSALPYQIERWDAANNRAEIWVKVDTVKGNDSTQSIKLYYGNSGATSQSNGTAVFDTALGYTDVWHLGDTTGVAPRPNAIANRFKATPVSFAAGYQAPAGVIGRAESLTGGPNGDSTTFLAINEGTPTTRYNFATGLFTYTAWINPRTVSDNFVRFISLVGTEAGDDRIFFSVNNNVIIGRLGVGSTSNATNSTTTPNVGEWNHIAMVFKRGTAPGDTVRLYHNGAQIAQSNAAVAILPNVARNFVRIGKDYINTTSDMTYNGLIDEARISHVARSADYIKLSYASQGTFQNFTNIGLGVATVPDAPTGVTATAGPANSNTVNVSWLAGSNGGAAITGYTVTASPGTATCQATAPATTCTVTGLTPATPYTFTVKATNSVGASAASAASSAVTVVGILSNTFVTRTNGRPFTYRLPAGSMENTDRMTLTIADIHGRTVWSKTVSPRHDKVSEIAWNGKSNTGARASAGMYLVRISLESNGKSLEFTQKALDFTPAR